MHKYRLVAKKGEGTFSEVLKAQCVKNGKYVAIKCMKNHFDSLDQVNNLREIQALRRLSPHPHIIKLLEVLYDQPTGRLALVFELMDMNIYELIRGRRHYVADEQVRSYMYQLLKSLDHMHRNGIFHRDIKPENILIMDDVLKLADFGSCRGIYSKQPYTEYISTRWYRAPECLLTDGYYNYKMDMWGVGCVMFEIVALYPLFPGNNELDQIQKIHAIVGTPPPELLARFKRRCNHAATLDFPPCQGSGLGKLLAHVPPDCADLIAKLLAYNPDERLSARQALRHPYFKEARERERRARAALQPDPVAGAAAVGCGMTVGGERCSQAGGLPPDEEDEVQHAEASSSCTKCMRASNGAPAVAAELAAAAAAAAPAAAVAAQPSPAAAAAAGSSLPSIACSSGLAHGHAARVQQQQQQGGHTGSHHHHQQQQHQHQQQHGRRSPPGSIAAAGACSSSVREREPPGALVVEGSAASLALHGSGLVVQASMDSIWEEPSEAVVGVAAAGQLLPPLVGKASSIRVAVHQSSTMAGRTSSRFPGGGQRVQAAARTLQHSSSLKQADAGAKVQAAYGGGSAKARAPLAAATGSIAAVRGRGGGRSSAAVR